MRLYATEAELADWLGAEAPANAGALLRSASSLIRAETRSARYVTDTDGYPADTALRTVFREAVCAQAAYWADHKVDPSLGKAGVTPPAVSKSIGSASITYGQPTAGAQDMLGLAPDAYYLLSESGLLSGGVVIL